MRPAIYSEPIRARGIIVKYSPVKSRHAREAPRSRLRHSLVRSRATRFVGAQIGELACRLIRQSHIDHIAPCSHPPSPPPPPPPHTQMLHTWVLESSQIEDNVYAKF